ncbi:hypothetical protein SAY87_026168 [Trapa incisa]|uniref:pectinesterase n=1 Tax=Trapa incisa TaxID=236973 RepID=A0AAN7GIV6_9MYRT|nr:hypothetical protein SAY87_026168 [Trapa incisa]
MTPFLFHFKCLLFINFFSLPSSSSSSSYALSQQHPTPPLLPFAPPSRDSGLPPAVQHVCKATRFPDVCASSLSQFPPAGHGPSQIMNAAISISAENLRKGQDKVNRILVSSAKSLNRTAAAKICLDLLRNSTYRMESVFDALSRAKTKDARAWLSAALVFQYDCWSALKFAYDTTAVQVNKTMAFLDSLTMQTSNALAMVVSYDIYGNDTGLWRLPMTERDGFWAAGIISSSGSDQGFTAGFTQDLKADAIVCQDDADGCYGKIQDAVVAASNNRAERFVIHIKAGVFKEIVRVPLEKKNVVFVGDGVGKTVITGSLTVGQLGMTTYNTATVGECIMGDGFMATGITFENTAGPVTHQAVAFRSDSDFSYVEKCEFLGNQDTLYAHSLRQYYKSCSIEGNIDFILWNSATIFQDCEILVRPRQQQPEKGEDNVVVAQGRTDPSQSTGFVFQNCLINGTEAYMNLYRQNHKIHNNFLGRPWKKYSRAVFINCNLETLISPQGWMPWDGDFALTTLFFGEFNNTGPGSAIGQRVWWSSQIPAAHLDTYSFSSFIQGDEWVSRST